MMVSYKLSLVAVLFVFIGCGLTQSNNTSDDYGNGTTSYNGTETGSADTDAEESTEESNTYINVSDSTEFPSGDLTESTYIIDSTTSPPTAEESTTTNMNNKNNNPDMPNEEEDTCLTTMHPTVFTLLVSAVCFICLLFMYTVICSCVFAKRRIGDVEMQHTPTQQKTKREVKQEKAKLKSETLAKKEATKKKRQSENKERDDKKKNAKAKETQTKKEKIKEKKANTEKEHVEHKQTKDETKGKDTNESATSKGSPLPENNDTAKEADESNAEQAVVGSSDTVKREDLVGELQQAANVDDSGPRISTIPPPPPLDDAHQPTTFQTDVSVEPLPPPPPPECLEVTTNLGSNVGSLPENKGDADVQAPGETDVRLQTSVATTEQANVQDSAKQAEDLADVGLKLDEVLDMLETMKQ